jgi:predicted nucleic acid-binding Zn ribbon protein
MNYDEWKLDTPDEETTECRFCSNQISADKDYCSSKCAMHDNE